MKKLKGSKGVTLAETAVSLALLAIVIGVAATLLISASRLGGRAIKQLNLNNLTNNIEICLTSDEPAKALSFYFDTEVTREEQNTFYFDRGFASLCKKEGASFELDIYIGDDISSARIYEIDTGDLLYKFEREG